MISSLTLSRRQAWSGFLTLLALVAFYGASPWARRLDNFWLDNAFRILRQHAPLAGGEQVVIVGIDDDDLREFGMPLAALHRQLGAFLQAMAVARPAAVGLDVVLPSASADRLQAGLDAALARGILAARGNYPLVLGITTDASGKPRPIHEPFLRLAGNDAIGFVFLSRDEDVVIRRYDDRIGSQGEAVPTVVSRIARALGREPIPGLVQYALGPEFTYLPLRQVLKWQETGDHAALAARFAGRVVLLGSVLPFEDQHATPVRLAAWDRQTDTSHGVLIHAQQVRSVLESAIIPERPRWASILLALLLVCAWWLRPTLAAGIAVIVLAGLCMAGGLYALRSGISLPVSLALAALLGSFAARTGLAAALSARERRRLRASFDGLVSPAVLEEMVSGRLTPDLAGERRDICVLFSDIRSFTTLSESMAPEDVTALLNDYFGRMTRAIHAQGGTLDKFIGDGIMAFFGAPCASANPCAEALAAGKAMLTMLDEFNHERAAQGGAPLAIGIGLHYGPAVIGYIGSRERNEYSAIGDTVNSASRIEGLTKDAGYPLLLSAAVAQKLGDTAGLVSIGPMAVKGRAPIEVFGWRPAVGQHIQEVKKND